MAFWPCVMAGSRRELHPALRGVYLGGAIVLAGITLTSQSRGWLFSLPLVCVVFLLISPNRVRTAVTLLGVGIVSILIAPTALDVFHAFGNGGPVQPALDSAQRTIFTAAVLTGMVGAFIAFFDRRIEVKPKTTERVGRGMLGIAGTVVVVGLIAFLAVQGSPLSWLGDRWDEFKSAPEPTSASARFTQTLGSQPLRLLARRVGPVRGRPDPGHRRRQLPRGLSAGAQERRGAVLPALDDRAARSRRRDSSASCCCSARSGVP